MLKLLWRLGLLVLAALALVWLAERPGSIAIHWQGQDIELSVFVGVVFLAVFTGLVLALVWLLRRLWQAPAAFRGSRKARREKKAYEALSRGIIAAGAGDAQAAERHAAIAAATLKHEPLVKLLGAQAAQLRGDKAEVSRVFEGLAQNQETALLGLRGLHAQALERGDFDAAHQHAEAAHSRHNRLAWAQNAVLQGLTRRQDWLGASKQVGQMVKSGQMGKSEGAKAQAALLAAAALAAEAQGLPEALKLASDAHGLDSSLVPAALVTARAHAALGQPKRALKALRDTWLKFPHRDLAAAAADLLPDSPEDQFERVRELVGKEPSSSEGRFALARAAVACHRHEAAREVLAVEAASEASAGVCALMAHIEEQAGNGTAAKQWLARGLHAPADPVWMADGVALAQWSAVSPANGQLVTCVWRSPRHRAVQAQLGFTPVAEAKSVKTEAPLATPAATLAAPRLPDDPGIEQDS